jgi:putative membrane protein
MNQEQEPNFSQLLGHMQGVLAPTLLSSVCVTLIWALFGFSWLDLTPVFIGFAGVPLLGMGLMNAWSARREYERDSKAWAEVMANLGVLGVRLGASILVSGRAKKPKEHRRRAVQRVAALGHVLRGELRGVHALDDMRNLLTEEELASVRSSADVSAALIENGFGDLKEALAAGFVTPEEGQVLSAHLDKVTVSWLSCRTAASTPTPGLARFTVPGLSHLFAVVMPFGLVTTTGWLTPLVVPFLAVVLLLPDVIASILSRPFGANVDGLPLYRDCRRLERQLLASLGDTDLPREIESSGAVIR